VQVFRKDSLIKRFPDIRPLPRYPLYNIDQLTVTGAGLMAEIRRRSEYQQAGLAAAVHPSQTGAIAEIW
jgi:hypothetical protein